MSDYDLLRSLYLGAGANADLVDKAARDKLHVPTALDKLLPKEVHKGRDVVLTGNPGDGKSHLAKRLEDRGLLRGAELELDLSATSADAVIRRWEQAVRERRSMVLCAHEGPLLELLAEMRSSAILREHAAELQGQVGRLTAPRRASLAQRPKLSTLVDLADRNLADERLIHSAVRQASKSSFDPEEEAGFGNSVSANMEIFFESEESPLRLARLLACAGRRLGAHVTFRQLWAAIAYALCRGASTATLRAETCQGDVSLTASPLANLCRPRAQGALIAAFREHCDPASFTVPTLDEDLWSEGEPRAGRWEVYSLGPYKPPAAFWDEGDRQGAMAQLASLKRLVALAHSEGGALVDRITAAGGDLPSQADPAELVERVCGGIRRCYLSPDQELGAPEWLVGGLPLWVGLSFQHKPVEQRPHVAVAAIPTSELTVDVPERVKWLKDALGPLPEVAWLRHRPSGLALRLDPQLLEALSIAASSRGALQTPPPVARFLSRVAGWGEAEHRTTDTDQFAVLAQPRGELVAAGDVRIAAGVASYA